MWRVKFLVQDKLKALAKAQKKAQKDSAGTTSSKAAPPRAAAAGSTAAPAGEGKDADAQKAGAAAIGSGSEDGAGSSAGKGAEKEAKDVVEGQPVVLGRVARNGGYALLCLHLLQVRSAWLVGGVPLVRHGVSLACGGEGEVGMGWLAMRSPHPRV